MINKRVIVRNTFLLNIRMLFSLLVSLYTSRVILHTLGVVDFGVYNVVGGVVSLFTIFSGPMSGSTRRFLSYEIGSGNDTRLRQVMSTSLLIHAIIGAIIVLLTMTIGYWFVLDVLQIPTSRFEAALYVLFFSAITTFFSIITLPYISDVIAHEQMDFFAVISIFEVVLRLLMVLLLVYGGYDKLILFSFLILVLQLLSSASYYIYCRKKFFEARTWSAYDKSVAKDVLSFVGWTMTGGITGICNSQGINMLLNVFFGPTVNAARGIAIQVQSAITNFCNNIQQAINPQIIKSYASNELENMYKLIVLSSKISFLFLLLLSLPVFFNTNYILNLWLGDFPLYTVDFIRIILIISLIEVLAGPLINANHATGMVKKFQIIVESVSIMGLPLSYLYLKFVSSIWPCAVYFILLAIAILCQLARILIVLPNIGMSFSQYFCTVILPLVKVTVITTCLCGVCVCVIDNDNFLSLIIFCVFDVIIVIISSFWIALSKNERHIMRNYCGKILKNRIG